MTGVTIGLWHGSSSGAGLEIAIVLLTIVTVILIEVPRRRKARRDAAPSVSSISAGTSTSPPAQPARTDRVFLCYRRTDSADVAGRIFDRLVAHLGRDAVFKDVDSIPLGVDYRQHISEALSACSAVLVVIGPQWLRSGDQEGRRRLDDPADPVRIEVETALSSKPHVIPLLVRRAVMPGADDLPLSLQPLAFRNGLPIRPDPDFDRDMERLNQTLASATGTDVSRPYRRTPNRTSGQDLAQVRFNVDTNKAVTAYVNGDKVAKFRSSGSYLHRFPPGRIAVEAKRSRHGGVQFVGMRRKLEFDLQPGETAVVAIEWKVRSFGRPRFSAHLEDITR